MMMPRTAKTNAMILAQPFPIHSPQARTIDTKPMMSSAVPMTRGINVNTLCAIPKYASDRILAVPKNSVNPINRK
jgi:hypothetical protein